MKDSPSSSQNKSKESAAEKAIGGQPESDQEAREAGLSSATSGGKGDPQKDAPGEEPKGRRYSKKWEARFEGQRGPRTIRRLGTTAPTGLQRQVLAGRASCRLA